MDVLLGRRDLATGLGIGDIPHCRQLVHSPGRVGDRKRAGIHFAEQPEHRRQPPSILVAAWIADSRVPAVCSMSVRR